MITEDNSKERGLFDELAGRLVPMDADYTEAALTQHGLNILSGKNEDVSINSSVKISSIRFYLCITILHQKVVL